MMIEKRLVQWYAADADVDLDVAEREIILTYVLKILADAGLLPRLAFKGGTAIRKLYVSGQGRFSLDLDFTSVGERNPDSCILEVVGCLHNQNLYGIAFEAPPADYYANPESCGADVTYRHEWTTGGKFGIEISFRAAPLLAVRPIPLRHERYFEWLGIAPPDVPSLDLHEVIGEKIRAAYQRTQVRDVYDLYQLAGQRFDRDLVRRIAVLKLWESRWTFDPAEFFSNIREGRYHWPDLRRLVRRGSRVDPGRIIAGLQKDYSFLDNLDAEEELLANDDHQREQSTYERLVRSLGERA